ncbi:MAG: nucleotide exchange factor GrpE, partial [Bacteroidota bacterium]
TKMEVKKGDKFDDENHEAITQIPSEEELEGKVVDVVEAGYTLGEKIVRFAKVVVGAKQ